MLCPHEHLMFKPVIAVCRLVLEWNALGVWDEAFSLFCDGLASNSVLTQLDLRNNQINHHGASELALALKRNTTLQVLGEVFISSETHMVVPSLITDCLCMQSNR